MKFSDLWKEDPIPEPVEYVWRPAETLLAALLVALILGAFLVVSR